MTETLPYKSPETPTPPLATPASTAPHEDSWPVEARFAAWVILAAGAIFRICKWGHWRSLWLDELYLSHSILTRGFVDLLFKPLDYWQAAPMGFLAMDRLFVDCFGGGERVLRLPSLLAGLASLPLFYAVARRVLPLRAALMALLLFVSLSPLIYYSQETKQYSFDVAVNLAIMLTALNLWRNGPTRRSLIWYAAVGGIGLFFSHPAVFVLAGTGLVLLIGGPIKARRGGESILPWLLGVGGAGLICGALEFLNYWLFLRPTLQDKDQTADLVAYWSQPDFNGFVARGPHDILPWFWKTFWKLIHEPATMNINNAGLGLMLVLVGIAALFISRRRPAMLMILSPLLPALVASFLKRYPFADRLALYMVPALTLLMAAGLDWLWGDHSMGRAMAAMLMLCIIGGASVGAAMDDIWQADGREETEPVYTWIRYQWHPGDMLYLSHNAQPSFDYYAPKVGLTGLIQIPYGPPGTSYDPQLQATANNMEFNSGFRKAFLPKPSKPAPPDVQGYVCVQPDRSHDRKYYQSNDGYRALYLTDMDNLMHPPPGWNWPPVKRVWVVFTHTWDGTGFQPDSICLPELERNADRIGEHEEQGAAVYLYQAK